MRPIVWTIRDIKGIIKERQKNQFDANILVSGDRGNGKSSFLVKLFYLLQNYNPQKHQVYTRPDVIRLLSTQQHSICFDDEAINSGYKRDFQQKGQQELIKIVTAYRDNFNVYGSAIPNFFSLDKDLRDMIFLHIHVLERGMAVVHMPIQGRLYATDRWDARNNAKIEESWGAKISKDPKFRKPYHKLSTFRGYIYFGDITPKQRKIYERIKREKRGQGFGIEYEDLTPKTFYEKIFPLILKKQIGREALQIMCRVEGKKYLTVTSKLREMLKEKGITEENLSNYLVTSKEQKQDHSKKEIDELLPDL